MRLPAKQQPQSSAQSASTLGGLSTPAAPLEHQNDMGRPVLSAHGVSQYEIINPIEEENYTNPWISEFKGRNLSKTPDSVETFQPAFSFMRLLFFILCLCTPVLGWAWLIHKFSVVGTGELVGIVDMTGRTQIVDSMRWFVLPAIYPGESVKRVSLNFPENAQSRFKCIGNISILNVPPNHLIVVNNAQDQMICKPGIHIFQGPQAPTMVGTPINQSDEPYWHDQNSTCVWSNPRSGELFLVNEGSTIRSLDGKGMFNLNGCRFLGITPGHDTRLLLDLSTPYICNSGWQWNSQAVVSLRVVNPIQLVSQMPLGCKDDEDAVRGGIVGRHTQDTKFPVTDSTIKQFLNEQLTVALKQLCVTQQDAILPIDPHTEQEQDTKQQQDALPDSFASSRPWCDLQEDLDKRLTELGIEFTSPAMIQTTPAQSNQAGQAVLQRQCAKLKATTLCIENEATGQAAAAKLVAEAEGRAKAATAQAKTQQIEADAQAMIKIAVAQAEAGKLLAEADGRVKAATAEASALQIKVEAQAQATIAQARADAQAKVVLGEADAQAKVALGEAEAKAEGSKWRACVSAVGGDDPLKAVELVAAVWTQTQVAKAIGAGVGSHQGAIVIGAHSRSVAALDLAADNPSTSNALASRLLTTFAG